MTHAQKQCGCGADAGGEHDRHGAHRGKGRTARTLAACAEGERVLISSNDDLKTLEMGFCGGNVAELLHNASGSLNIVVKIHGHRYAIPRETAQNIKVK